MPKTALQEYEVTITETLEKKITVEAKSREEAEMLVEANWNNSEYILGAESFTGVKFSAVPVRNLDKLRKQKESGRPEQKRIATSRLPFPTNKKETFGYEITKGILFSNGNGFALGKNLKFQNPYATYQILDDNGVKLYCAGHFFSNARAAAAEYDSRVFQYMADHPGLKEVRLKQERCSQDCHGEKISTLAEQLAEAKKQVARSAANSHGKKRGYERG